MKIFALKAFAVFFLLCIFFVPFPSLSGDVQLQVTTFIFGKPVFFLQEQLFDDSFSNVPFSSDTRSLNILIVLLGFIAVIIAFSIKKPSKLLQYARILIVYYLALLLLKYGFDKIFLGQFYTPEPNILYTPFGHLSKDILYWSTMGTSPVYSIITGSLEVAAGLLLLFRRTRPLGLLLSLVALLQIVVINFSFDISVKTFSLLLFGIALFASWPFLKTLYVIFILIRPGVIHSESIPMKLYMKNGLKLFVIGFMLIQVLYSHYTTQIPAKLHGAYAVEQIVLNGKTLETNNFPVKRVFFHKDNFIIFQNGKDEMTDYHYEFRADKRVLILSDYRGNTQIVSYSFVGDFLVLNFESRNMHLTARALPWKDLPALQDELHFTVDALIKPDSIVK